MWSVLTTTTSTTRESVVKSSPNAKTSIGKWEFVKDATKDGKWSMVNALLPTLPTPRIRDAKHSQTEFVLSALPGGTLELVRFANQLMTSAILGQIMETA